MPIPSLNRYRAALCAAAFIALSWACLPGCSRNEALRAESRRALARWEDQRLAPADSLRSLLTGPDARLRLAAARTAGLIGRTDILPELIELLDDPSDTIRGQAAFSLGLLGDERAVEPLEQMAAGPRPALRMDALRALGRLENSGAALLTAAEAESAAEAALAWDGLRNQAARVDSTQLDQAIRASLARPEADVRWRVLRCVERFAPADLGPDVAAQLDDANDQVAVHACRALGRIGGVDSLRKLLDSFDSQNRFRGRELSRVRIAALRSLGTLAPAMELFPDHEIDRRADEVAALLIQGAGDDDAFVAETALNAMRNWVAERELPPEAATQESLLPVWRIRMARAAQTQLSDESLMVRRAAIGAWAQLRGSGAGDDLLDRLQEEDDPRLHAALLNALSLVHPQPVAPLMSNAAPRQPSVVRVAALTGLAAVLQREESSPIASTAELRATILDRIGTGTWDQDFVVAATAASLLGDFPGDRSLGALCRGWDRPDDLEDRDVQLAILGSMRQMLDADTLDGSAWSPSDSLNSRAREILREAFDSPDIRVRWAARDAAEASGTLPGNLIPSKASLQATLPPFRRSSLQPPVALPGRSNEVSCRTDRGTFTIRLDAERAPNTCAVFLDLIARGYYENLDFHRVVPDFVVQGGCPRGDGWGGPGYTIRSEWSEIPFQRGVVGIAHSGKDTGGSQFFVTLSEQPHLNARYTVFGKVTQGMEVVDRLQVGDRFSLELTPR